MSQTSFRTAVIDVTILQRLIAAIHFSSSASQHDAEQKAASSVEPCCGPATTREKRLMIGARALTQIADAAEVSLQTPATAAAWADQVRSDVKQARAAVSSSRPGIRSS